ncbi:MAG: YtaF, partial [Paenibacillus sp.]|nr:YtaF [Paenibacillus sp.]
IGIGLWAVVQMFRQRSAALQDASDNGTETQDTTGNEAVSTGAEAAESLIRTVIRIELKRLGLVIEILRTPALADRDRSGYISPSEAVLLGLALSLDAFGAGFGAAFIGFAPLLTAAVVVLASGSFLSAGLSFGLRFAEARWMQRLAVLPGFVLILMGVMKLM